MAQRDLTEKNLDDLPKEAYEYIDNSRLHVFEMSRVPADTRKLFQSDMRIVADYLAEDKILLLPAKGFSIWKHSSTAEGYNK